MAEYKWPEADKRTLIGKRISRVDGPHKVSGRAKYSYDINRPGMLFGKIVRCPHAHAKIVSIDTSAAEKMPGVKAVQIIQDVGAELHWAGASVVALAAVDEPTAEDAARAIKVTYEVLPHLVTYTDLKAAEGYTKPANENTQGEPDKAFRRSRYGYRRRLRIADDHSLLSGTARLRHGMGERRTERAGSPVNSGRQRFCSGHRHAA